MHVLHVYKTFFPDSVGGLEQAIGQTVLSTSKLGIRARILSLSRMPEPIARSFGPSEHLRFRETGSIASNSFSLHLAARFGQHVRWADIVHYHFPWPFADVLHLAWRVKKPSVVTYHSDIVRQRRLLTVYRPLMHTFLRRVDQIVATSPNYLETSEVLRRFRDKTTVIPIGLDPETYPPLQADTLQRWEDQIGRGFFLFVGVIRYYKGLHILLDALVGTDIRVVIVGAGPIEDELKRRANVLGLHNVTFLGALPETDKVALLSLCDAVVFPSHLRSEAFGVSLLEGAMFGKPMISSEIGTGTSFVNIHGETGLVVPPSDPAALRAALARLHEDAALRVRMGQAARRRFLERFTAGRMAESHLALYRKILGMPAARSAEAQETA